MGLLLVLICAGCEKKLEATKPALQEVAERIYATDNFTIFAKRFLVDFKSMADYYQSPGIQKNRGAFIGSLKDAGEGDTKLEAAFANYSLSMEEVVARKNRLDNDLLQLFNQERILLKYSETEVWTIIREAINLGWKSETPVWQNIRYSTMSGGNAIKSNAAGGSQQVNKLDGNEIWDCVKEAVGVGSASILGIAALQKLASEGIQTAVITLSKWLAKRAGWIGAAIMVIDFSSCLYHESVD